MTDLVSSICRVSCGQLILIFFNNEILQCQKIVQKQIFLCSEFFHNIQKEWKEQVNWKTKHPILICSEHFDKDFYRKLDSKILRNCAVKMGCVNNSLQVARHDHSYPRENLSKEQLFERL